MMYLLPAPNNGVKRLLSPLFQLVKGYFRSRSAKYKFATILDVILIAVILINGRQPAQRLISPMTSLQPPFYSATQTKTTRETFAFVPDLARNKFPRIDTTGLTYLSFFDVPLNESGEMNYSSKGYVSFHSDEAQDLFDKARSQNAKIFLTIVATDENIIKSLLDNHRTQEILADQAITEIEDSNLDGISVNFEAQNSNLVNYQHKFTEFITYLTNRIHKATPHAQVAAAIPSSYVDNKDLYNVEDLGEKTDRIFLVASNFIVPEVRDEKPSNPVYGYNENEYWKNVSSVLSNLQQRIPADKLVMERAWYGNGNNYPLYVPKNDPEFQEDGQPPSDIQLDQETLERLVAGVPEKGKQAARTTIPLIVKALDQEGILDTNVLAYALATVEHETDETFEAIEEIQGRINARRLGYEGGANYFGRGFIQITHLRNYREFGHRIGMGDKLVKNPELALNPEIAAKILAAYFKDNNVANLASKGHFVDARAPINPDYNGYSVANLAMKYEI